MEFYVRVKDYVKLVPGLFMGLFLFKSKWDEFHITYHLMNINHFKNMIFWVLRKFPDSMDRRYTPPGIGPW